MKLHTLLLSVVVLFLIAFAFPVSGQQPPFNAGSNGSDGDLTFPNANPGDTIIFDPKSTALFPGGLDNDNDNIYHFKAITIPQGVRVILRADKLGGPLYWLAQGNVQILGHLDLDGNPGALAGFVAQTFAVPGPGGFHGGGGGDNATRPPTPGFGPEPGKAANPAGSGCRDVWGGGGAFTGNDFLVPLIGGSGGGGYYSGPPAIGPGGGGGGGAILIASSGTIAIINPGAITARGGLGGNHAGSGAGSGAGGAIRLVASRIEGNGQLLAHGQTSHCDPLNSAIGRVRLEAFQQAFNGTINAHSRSASPFDTFIPTTAFPSVRVISVAGVAVNPNPSGTFEVPDVTINAGGEVSVEIETRNVPTGTLVKLQLFSENGPSQSIDFPALTGSGVVLRATKSVAFPSGFSRGFIRASFVQ